MNVTFHTICALGAAVAFTDTIRLKEHTKNRYFVALWCFITGVALHGVLDYMPHCYPINSLIDVILSLVLIVGLTLFSRKGYQPILVCSFLGNILPDAIDLAPSIMNKHLGLHLKAYNHLFPWHLPDYSGSIYQGNCEVSFLNYAIVLVVVMGILWFRKRDVKAIFRF